MLRSTRAAAWLKGCWSGNSHYLIEDASAGFLVPDGVHAALLRMQPTPYVRIAARNTQLLDAVWQAACRDLLLTAQDGRNACGSWGSKCSGYAGVSSQDQDLPRSLSAIHAPAYWTSSHLVSRAASSARSSGE